MKRLGVLAAVALAGCGSGPQAQRPPRAREAVRRERADTRRSLERVRHSSLPKDAQKQLEEAQKLLDDAGK